MSSHVVIRPATDDDAAAFHECLDAVARERNGLAMTAAPPSALVAEFRRQLRAAGGIDLLAFSGQDVVGWIDIHRPPWEGMHHVGSLGMGVRRDHRGQGLGRALVSRALEAAAECAITRVELEVFASNVPAIRLYESTGFQHEGRKRGVRRLDGRTDDICIMARLDDAAT
jgi:RimJ/RimL family protein N-acetyltransferase